MAQQRTQAWLTSCLDDDSVAKAIVLAESIRRTKSTRTVAVIISENVTAEKRVALGKAFDAVFSKDLSQPLKVAKDRQEVHAKLFAFSLLFLEKCVFVSPDCLLLENADQLFDDTLSFKFLKEKADDGSLDLSMFMFTPIKELWAHLWQSLTQNGIRLPENLIGSWLMKQDKGIGRPGRLGDETMVKLSLKEGALMTDKTHAPIIQFVGLGKNCVEQMQSMNNRDLGLPETKITTAWLELYHQVAAPLLRDPFESAPLPGNVSCTSYVNEPIAIIGMSCRYPGANSLGEFWNMLYEGEEGIREPPAFRWTKEHSLRVTQQQRKTNVGFLSTTVDEFDAKFFGVSPKEAAYMDPQARLLHEVMWEGLEDSGIDPLSLYGTHTGIFTGSWMNDYKDIVQGSTEQDFFRTYMGNSIGAAAARLSFLLGLTGPSIATESGCSSAIVALDLAVKSLRIGESNLAVAGGVNLLLHPFTSNIIEYVISPNGRCKTFDAKADGFGRAEGCGVLVLKRLSDAMRDRDNIWGIIRGSAVSQEGLSRSLGTPTVHCEALAMQLALQDANVSPGQVSFVETHGTGTAVGDPMEVAAIAKAYHSPGRETPLVIGSVKTNVGHTESCSGITGIMKTILAMQHELIPKHRNLESINPEIFLDSIPAMIPMEAVPWPKVTGKPRIAGVSSFGITGTDGHVIIEEAPDYELPKFTLGLERPTHIVKISGKSSEALEELLVNYENLFSEKIKSGQDSLADSAFSGNVGRANFNHRAFVIAQDYEEAANALKEKKCLLGEVKDSDQHQICFLFTGQGSQYQGMAKLLYSTSPVFRVNFDACDRTLRNLYNLSIRHVLWESDSSSKELSRTIYSQTSIFCVEYCLFKLWQSWGIQPDYVLGHSLGEFCAAVAAGILDFKDALKLVAERSRLIDNLPRGSMLVIKASQPEVKKLMKEANLDLDFAAVNSPDQTVVAGDTEAVQSFLGYLKGQGQKAIVLEATHAFHSKHMDPMLEKYRVIAETIEYKQGNGAAQYVSGMEGRIITDSSDITADYWVRHTREKVSFVDACAALRETGCKDFLEVGPQPVLSSFVMMNNEDLVLNCLPSLRRGTDDWQTMLTSLGKLYLLGYKVNWKGFDEPYLRKKVSLPFHPMNRKSFWVEVSGSQAAMIHPLVGYPMNNASAMNIFQNDLTVKSVPYVKDHCIGERIVFPGAGFTEMCLSAGYCVANGLSETLELPNRAIRLENVRIEAPLELKEEKSCRLQVIVDLPESTDNATPDQDSQGGFRVKVYHQNTSTEETGKWVLHASSSFIPVASTKDSLKLWSPPRIAEVIATGEPMDPETFYKRVSEAGLKFGETFRMIKNFWAVKHPDPKVEVDDVVTEMRIPSDFHKYLLHPLIIDAVFQTGILTKYRYEDSKLKVPVSIGRLTLFGGLDGDGVGPQTEHDSLFLHAFNEDGKCFVYISTATHTPIALVEDVELIDTNVKTIESVLEQQSSSLPDAWEESWKVIPSPFKSAVEQVDVTPIFADPQFQDRVRLIRERPDEDWDLNSKTNRLLYLYILNALYELGWSPKVGEATDPKSFCKLLGILPEHHQFVRFYFTVLQEEAGILENNSESWKLTSLPLPHDHVKLEMVDLCNFLKATKVSIVTQVYENIAKGLSKILCGEESALSYLFPVDEDQQHLSAFSYYIHHPGLTSTTNTAGEVCRTIFQQSYELNSKEPGRVYRFLEVGSGTGSASGTLLQWLKEIWGDRFEYYFTDISQTFLTKGEKRFEEYGQNIKYTLFNIEQSPLSQGIPLNYFDMVSATNVLHATRDLEETLVHLRQTLRTGGVLNVVETVAAARDITFVFGPLEGYWCFKDFHWRPHHCCITEEAWAQLLEHCGFRFSDSFRTQVDPISCIYATAVDIKVDRLGEEMSFVQKPYDTEAKKEWLIFADQDNFEVCSGLANTLDSSGFNVTIVLKTGRGKTTSCLKNGIDLTSIQADNEESTEIDALLGNGEQLHGIIYAWGLDTRERDQQNVALPLLHLAKSLVGQRKPSSLYVLTQGVTPASEDVLTVNPTPATLFGMLKALKNESPGMCVRYVDLDQNCSPETMVNQVLYELARNRGPKEQNRVQVAYRGNVRLEPRMVHATLPKPIDELKLPPSTDRFQLILPKSRMIKDLEFTTLEAEDVAETEVEIRVKAYALNFRDIFAVIKPSAEFEKINGVGLDFAGVVTKSGALSRWSVGDRVFGTNFKETQLASHLVLESSRISQVPDTMTFCEAATIPAVFLTAYYCLIYVAKLKKGETVLIHTGSGGVGLAAIQLAKNLGAKIITTAGNPRKRAYLRAQGIEHVFHSRNTSYEQDILKVTNGRGVDVVLNSITGPGFKEATLRASAQNARFIEMSKLTIWTPEEIKALRPDVDYSIVDLTSLDGDKFASLQEDMTGDIGNGHIHPIPAVRFGALHIRQALEYFQKARHIGKVVCAMPDVTIQGGQYKVNVPQFNGESTYLITGGLGGIGFEVCKWMLTLGATNIVLTGRRPPANDVADQIENLKRNGWNVVTKLGDVGDVEQCTKIIREIREEQDKPLRGVMHCAGVLRDNFFSNQTWESFQATYNPKVNGTWNLHHLTIGLPLEHFVVYSSVSAMVGFSGQPNHVSANCFEDAFIHYRHSLGLPGTTINWGQWAQVGCAKEISLSGVAPVSVKRMLNGMELAFKCQKKQVAFSDFESFSAVCILCPTMKSYLDEKLLSTANNLDHRPGTVTADQFWQEMDDKVTKKEKMEVMSAHIKSVLRAALRLEPDELVGDDDNIQELGVDSLMMLELKNSIQALLGSRVSVTTNLIKNCNTVRLIANAVVEELMASENAEDQLVMEPLPGNMLFELMSRDSVLDESFQGAGPDTLPPTKSSEIKSVLVTGVTGLLGPYLVSQLTKDYPLVEKITCLIRGSDEITVQERLKATLSSFDLTRSVDMTKVECLPGDVTFKNMGLSKTKYDALCKSVDAVIHCAAKTDHVEPYRSYENGKLNDIRSINVGGLLNVLRFASTTKTKHVYYPSTFVCGVLGENDEGTLPDDWLAPKSLQTVVDNNLPGVKASKFVCEMLLEQANQRGIPCKVFRFPWIAGESDTGRLNYLNNLYILRFLSFLRANAMPSLTIPANFLPVDTCVKFSLNLFFRDDTPFEIYNIGHPSPQLEQEFVTLAKEELDRNVEVLDWTEYIRLLEDFETEDEALMKLYTDQKLISKYIGDAIILVKQYQLTPDTYFTNRKMSQYLPNYEQEISPSMEIMRRDLRFLKSTGFLDHFIGM